MNSSIRFHNPNLLQMRAPPGLEGCSRSPDFQTGTSSPSLDTPTPPPEWKRGGVSDIESGSPGTKTPPIVKQASLAHPRQQQPSHGFCVPAGKGPPKPPGLVLDAREKLRAKAAEYVATMLVPPPAGPVLSSTPSRPPPDPVFGYPARPTRGLNVHNDANGFCSASERQPHLPAPLRVGWGDPVGLQQVDVPTVPDACNFPAAHPAQDGASTSLPSCGSAGHPHACAAPCRYVKRKGGCRDGVRCRACHLCFWRRDENSNKTQQEQGSADVSMVGDTNDGVGSIGDSSNVGVASDKVAYALSVGSRGHPHQCASACRYVRRKSGCRNGAACPNCHACLWRRNLVDDKEPADSDQEDAPEINNESRNTLQGLIHLLIQSKEAEKKTSAGSESAAVVTPGTVGATRNVVAPPTAPTDVGAGKT